MDREMLQRKPSETKRRDHIEYGPLSRDGSKPYYKPLIHHTASLCFVLAVALGLIVLIEYALRVLPQHKLTPGSAYGQSKKREFLSQREDEGVSNAARPGNNVPMANAAIPTSNQETTSLLPETTPLPTPPRPLRRAPLKAHGASDCHPATVTQTEQMVFFVWENTTTATSGKKQHSLPVESLSYISSTTITQFPVPMLRPALSQGPGGAAPSACPKNNTIITFTTTKPATTTTFLDPHVYNDVPLSVFTGGKAPVTGAKAGEGGVGEGANPGGNQGGGGGEDNNKEGAKISDNGSNQGGSGADGNGDNGRIANGGIDKGGTQGGGGSDGGNRNGGQKSDSGGGGTNRDDQGGETGGDHRNGENDHAATVAGGNGQDSSGRGDSGSNHRTGDTNIDGGSGKGGVSNGGGNGKNDNVANGQEKTSSGSTKSSNQAGQGDRVGQSGKEDGSGLGRNSHSKDGKFEGQQPADDSSSGSSADDSALNPSGTGPSKSSHHSSSQYDDDEDPGANIPYTTVIDGHKVVITPTPSKQHTGKEGLDTNEQVVVASVKGESRLTTLTLPVDPARALHTGKSGAKTSPSQSNDAGDAKKPPDVTSHKYTESNKELTFVGSPINYFYGIYLPVLLAVAFQMVVGYLYTATKMMEPFAMLSKSDEGIAAKDFLWINYMSANDNIEPFTAMVSGHWLMLWVSILFTAAQLLSPLSSELLGIYPGFKKVTQDTVTAGASVWIHPQIARLMQAILGLISLLIIAAWFLLRHYQSKIYVDPSSIAGLASLANHPDTVRIFGSIDLRAPKDEILEQLAGTRWRLGWYATESTERYGIIASHPRNSKQPLSFYSPSATSLPDEPSSPRQLHDRPPTPSESTNLLDSSPYRSKLRTQLILNCLSATVLCGLFGVILAYQFNSTSAGFRSFMNAGNFGPRFLLTTAGIVLKGQWSRLERRSVVAAPFKQASERNSSGNSSPFDSEGVATHSHNTAVLASRTLVPLTTLATFLWQPRANLAAAALLASTCLAGEILVVILPGVPFDSTQTRIASQVARYMSLALLVVMLLILAGYWIASLLRWKKRVKLARTPSTVGTMMALLAGTNLANRFAMERELAYSNRGEEREDHGEGDLLADRKIRLMERRRGEGGKSDGSGRRCVVDFE